MNWQTASEFAQPASRVIVKSLQPSQERLDCCARQFYFVEGLTPSTQHTSLASFCPLPSPATRSPQVRDKRGLQAAIMRRLEVEEWDKERMRHFYYGLYGMGPWYWDMEERLHNPFFIGARGWNGPPESWIGENQVGVDDCKQGPECHNLAWASSTAHIMITSSIMPSTFESCYFPS
jgi:hypothetical protein